jgi:hypothetical protein
MPLGQAFRVVAPEHANCMQDLLTSKKIRLYFILHPIKVLLQLAVLDNWPEYL